MRRVVVPLASLASPELLSATWWLARSLHTKWPARPVDSGRVIEQLAALDGLLCVGVNGEQSNPYTY